MTSTTVAIEAFRIHLYLLLMAAIIQIGLVDSESNMQNTDDKTGSWPFILSRNSKDADYRLYA